MEKQKSYWVKINQLLWIFLWAGHSIAIWLSLRRTLVRQYRCEANAGFQTSMNINRKAAKARKERLSLTPSSFRLCGEKYGWRSHKVNQSNCRHGHLAPDWTESARLPRHGGVKLCKVRSKCNAAENKNSVNWRVQKNNSDNIFSKKILNSNQRRAYGFNSPAYPLPPIKRYEPS